MKELSLDLVGKRVRRIREQTKMSREAFAERVGISSQFLAEIEGGKKGMSAETLFKICSRFAVSADYILLGEAHSDHLSNPVEQALQHFPEPYLEMTEEIIRAIEKVAVSK